jgi:hypothetical protein
MLKKAGSREFGVGSKKEVQSSRFKVKNIEAGPNQTIGDNH